MSVRIDRVVKFPPEGLYLFRFEGQRDRVHISLATDRNGNGLFLLRPFKPKEDKSPTDAWRAICFAARRRDILANTLVNAEQLVPQSELQLEKALSPREAALNLLPWLTNLGWGTASIHDGKIVYLDNGAWVRNKKKPQSQEPS